MSIAQNQYNAARENNGLANVDSYKDCPLPEDYDVVELLGDVIQVEYVDVADDGKSLVRNGIILPNQVVDQKAWRIGKVLLAGPDCRQVKKGQCVMFPGDKGLVAIQKDGKTIVFLNEQRIFGIVKPSK
jgi:co-chaperonin GroES (HSP10)